MICVALAALMTACVDDMPQDSVTDGQRAFLVCNIGMVGNTRAADNPAIESMHSVRIIILNEKGEVENNEYISLNAPRESYSHIVELKSHSKKRVYVFANEESVSSISSQPTGMSGTLKDFLEGVNEKTPDFESKIASIYYEPDFSKPIPLNAMYEVEMPTSVNNRYIEQQIWLVRVATKFTFTFVNKRMYEDLTIKSFAIHGLSDKHFLMPKFTDNVVPVFPGFPTWIDWLKDVSDKSQVDPDNPTADESGWLTDYDIPETAKTVVKTYDQPFTLKSVKSAGEQGDGHEISNIYCCESKNLRSEGVNEVSMEQQYTVHLECASGGKERSFNIILPNLRALFRNTHPHVIVTMTDELFDVKAVVDVVPYRGCILDPYFGIPRD